MDDEYKPCRLCKLVKPTSGFSRNKGNKDGRDTRCTSCRREQYLSNKTALNEKARVNYQLTKKSVAVRNSTLEGHLKRLVNCSKRKRTEISLDDVLYLYHEQKGLCALTSKEMTHLSGHGHIPTNISIDRIDNDIGYTLENIQLVCHKANILRNDLSLEELKHWCKAILEKS